MCGIAGRVNSETPIDRAEIFRMTDLIRHRGPDDHGYHLRHEVGLGHRRLSIIDVAGGRQPLANEDDTIWIVYNGEVYNHVELRQGLVARGHVFRTRADTEAIVHAYEEWGADCVRRLRGMFAFAIWDDRRKELLLARDRLGIKPLYYAELDGDLVFASELKSLLAVSELDDALDERALAAYLLLRYVPAPLTMLASVRKLPPAHVLTWRAGRTRLRRYWDLLDTVTRDATPPTEAEAAIELRRRLDYATKLRLMSEVPLGAFLSGGLDSTMVTAAMLKEVAPPGTLKTFSIGYADDPTDEELGYARLAAGALGTEHHEVRMSADDAADELFDIVWHLDEPVADPACVPLYFLARRAREEVTVVLSGEGADEALGGYYIYRRMSLIEAWRKRVPGLFRLAEWATLFPSDRVRRLARRLARPLDASYRGVAHAFDDDFVAAMFCDAAATVNELLAPYFQATRTMSALRRMLYLDCNVWLPDDLLVKADKMTMAHALELRVPFLDHELMEYCWALPDALKVAGGVGKALLRRAARGRVPKAILERPKLGFATPTASWLAGGMRELATDLLLARDSLSRERLGGAVERLLARHRAGEDRSAELWPLLVLELWRKQFVKPYIQPRPEHALEVVA
jgi:asparagine synthase (glutamine-hydrolysing)